MSYTFKTNYSGTTTYGTKTFGGFSESSHAGEYILNKKSQSIYCVPIQNIKPRTQGNLLLLKKLKCLQYQQIDNTKASKQDLNYGLITTIDLKNVNVIENNNTNATPTPIDKNTTEPYLQYTIDKLGQLFGDTPCGLNNYENYRVYNGSFKRFKYIR